MPRILDSSQLIRPGHAHGGNRVDHPGTYRFEAHSHRDFCEWTLLLRGELRQRINGVMRSFAVGDLVFIREGDVHELVGQSADFINLTVAPKVLVAVASECEASAWLAQAMRLPQAPSFRLSPARREHLAFVFERALARRSRRSATVLALASCFDLAIERDGVEALPAWLQQGLAAIDDALEDGITVADLPAICGRDAAHIARSFRRYLDCTPSTWLNRCRARRAADLLVTTERSLTDIAYALGFSSQSYFTRCFTGEHAIAPRRYRELNRNASV
ncbi:MAG: AraC family transcriptional regulator [Planctomycetota bacterium]|jgi:AraC-like DNA-binding protein/quercetin dioxygenase-like cupin family protein|nr:AraC family transcriptional regulator [Planctomycetota bacterium]